MSVQSKPYYWLTCDHEGCDARSPSAEYEVTAWDNESGAVTCAEDEDWTHTDAGDFCFDHPVDEDES